MAVKMLAATQNINTNKQNHFKITKSIFAAVVCVYWYTGLPLVCYMKIFALKMLSMKIFFQILFDWQENDLVFSSEFEKNSIKTTT